MKYRYTKVVKANNIATLHDGDNLTVRFPDETPPERRYSIHGSSVTCAALCCLVTSTDIIAVVPLFTEMSEDTAVIVQMTGGERIYLCRKEKEKGVDWEEATREETVSMHGDDLLVTLGASLLTDAPFGKCRNILEDAPTPSWEGARIFYFDPNYKSSHTPAEQASS